MTHSDRITVGVEQDGAQFTARWMEFLGAHGASVKPLRLLREDFREQVRDCDGVMWHWAHYPHEVRLSAPVLLQVLETELGIATFPDIRTGWHYDNKIAQAYLLKSLDLPTPQTWIFWNPEDALEWSKSAPYPVVFKLSMGAGSSNVPLVCNPAEAGRKIGMMFSRSGYLPIVPVSPKDSRSRRAWEHAKSLARRCLAVPAYVAGLRYPPLPKELWMPHRGFVLFQEFMPGNDWDTRVTVIGDRAFAYRRMNRERDFRASGSGRFDNDPSKIDAACVKLALQAAQQLKTQSCAFDIVYRTPGDPVILEISYCYVDWMVEACPGHWDSRMQWHEGRMWPEEAHVIDFLQQIREKRKAGSP